MIKKITGVLFAVGVLALIVFTALGAGSYKSMLPEGLFTTAALEQQAVEQATEQPAPTEENSAEKELLEETIDSLANDKE